MYEALPKKNLIFIILFFHKDFFSIIEMLVDYNIAL